MTSFNPWIEIWTRPRVTLQQIVDTDPRRWVLLLAALTGLAGVIARATLRDVGEVVQFHKILVILAVMGPILGILRLYIAGWLVGLTGRWIGGKATYEQLRAVLAWAALPLVATLPVWGLELVLFGPELFMRNTPTVDASQFLRWVRFGGGIVVVVLSLWSFVLVVAGLSQIQGFAPWRALLNILLAVLAFAIPVFTLVFAVATVLR